MAKLVSIKELDKIKDYKNLREYVSKNFGSMLYPERKTLVDDFEVDHAKLAGLYGIWIDIQFAKDSGVELDRTKLYEDMKAQVMILNSGVDESDEDK